MTQTERELEEAIAQRKIAKEAVVNCMVKVNEARQRLIDAQEEHQDWERRVTVLTMRKERETIGTHAVVRAVEPAAESERKLSPTF